LGPGDLSRALAALPHRTDPRLVVGRETFDDAGVFVLSDDFALVQTVDFFAPIVDDAYMFGQIAAANALSDVYAMGGEPLTALNIVGFPTSKLPLTVLTELLRGGQDKVHEAGALVVGGHTIIDEELKYGLAVTGRADPRHLLTNAGARIRDRLLLTKPLGTGILATASKKNRLPESQLEALLASMTALNRDASRAALRVGARCATDITGFGLLGHALHIARASNVTIRIETSRIPTLFGTHEAWLAGVRTGGAERNEDYLRDRVEWGAASEVNRAVVIDPQTSGGLLVSISKDRVAEYVSLVPKAVEIGEVIAPARYGIVLD
jgi:selenide, water dikinase